MLAYRATDSSIIADGEAELLQAPDQAQGSLAHEPQGTSDERSIARESQSSHVELVVVIGVEGDQKPPCWTRANVSREKIGHTCLRKSQIAQSNSQGIRLDEHI